MKWPVAGRHKQDLSKTAKENIAKAINGNTYNQFLNDRNKISREIARKISVDYSNDYFTNVSIYE